MMKELALTINDKPVKGMEGSTVLEVCRANGIDIPTLCHLDGLSDVGACRMCVVEIQGERRPVPACTYPARDGLVIQTHTPEIERYRRLILELIFTERNHYCMFCEKSGDCELQKLAYRYQMDSVRYPYAFPTMRTDAVSDFIVIDHNRCILCGRCVRTCAEVEANFTLDFGKRGWKTVVSADLNDPLGKSSCVSCGACVQACPTGAIFSKLNLYTGKSSECEHIGAVCPVCGVGCELKVAVKDNNLVKIESASLQGISGPLCKKGRFDLLRSERARIVSPLVRDGRGKLKPCTLDEAINAAAGKLGQLKKSVAGIASARYPNETLWLFRRFLNEALESDWVDTLNGRYFRAVSLGIKQWSNNGKGLEIESPMEEILRADCILVVEADPEKTHPVVGSLIRRAVRHGGAKLIVI
ncbi:MAG: 2Fe-2S iron-sulfur cluster binding domain-containing protein, partial [Chloroflexi bacterium]|nr:2Fe-2S iron-sulfur cluster binding domain-containing protein [Chloroflexota bacterium]